MVKTEYVTDNYIEYRCNLFWNKELYVPRWDPAFQSKSHKATVMGSATGTAGESDRSFKNIYLRQKNQAENCDSNFCFTLDVLLCRGPLSYNWYSLEEEWSVFDVLIQPYRKEFHFVLYCPFYWQVQTFSF